jgi:chromosome segregation ATPase
VLKTNAVRSQRAAHEKYSIEVDEMNTEERVAKLEAKVDHIQADVTEVKTDVRDLKTDVRKLWETMHAQGKELREAVHAQGKELCEAINAQGKELCEAINAQGKELRAEMSALRAEMNTFVLGLEKFKWRFWAALTVLSVLQLLIAGGAPAAIARALKLP